MIAPESLRLYAYRVQGQSPNQPLPTSIETTELLRAAADAIEHLTAKADQYRADWQEAKNRATIAHLSAKAEALAGALAEAMIELESCICNPESPTDSCAVCSGLAALADYRDAK